MLTTEVGVGKRSQRARVAGPLFLSCLLLSVSRRKRTTIRVLIVVRCRPFDSQPIREGLRATPQMTPQERDNLIALMKPFLKPARGEWEIGNVDRYSLIDLIGKGGMGAVFLAVDEEKSQFVAFKSMSPETLADEQKVNRFKTEVQAQQSLTGDWIVRILDSGSFQADEAPQRLHYCCMEYIEGRTLEEKIRVWRALPQFEVARIGIELCHGLTEIHDQEIAHRDLTPGNVLLESFSGEKTLILDFGVAFHLPDSRQSEGYVGKFAYIAPEVWLDSEHTHPVLPASDLFSLGCVLYEALTGKRAFTNQVLASQQETPRHICDHVPQADRGLASIIMKLLKKQPCQRFQSASEVRTALEHVARSITDRQSRDGGLGLTTEHVHEQLAIIAGPTVGIPSTWCRGTAGVLLGLGRRVQMARDMHIAITQVTDLLMKLDAEHLQVKPDQSALSQLSLTIHAADMDFRRVAAETLAMVDGLPNLVAIVEGAQSAVHQFCENLTEIVHDQPPEESWKIVRDRLKGGLRDLFNFRKQFVQDHCFVMDRLLTLMTHIDSRMWNSAPHEHVSRDSESSSLADFPQTE